MKNKAAVQLGKRGAKARFAGKTQAQITRMQRRAARVRWDAEKKGEKKSN